MSGFKPIIKSCFYEKGQSGNSTGEMQFYNDPSGTYAIPTLGAGFAGLGTTDAACLLRRIRIEYLEGDIAHNKYVCQYSVEGDSNNSGDNGGGNNAMKKSTDRRWTYGGEMQSIAEPVGWKWASSTLSVEGVSIPKAIITVNFQRPTLELNELAVTDFKSKLLACAGKINAADFEGWGVGNVLCVGAEGGTFENESGAEKQKFNVGFSVRIIPSVATDAWQYMMRLDGEFDKPMIGAKYMYEKTGTTTFDSLFVLPVA
jgi:hypothetical protein